MTIKSMMTNEDRVFMSRSALWAGREANNIQLFDKIVVLQAFRNCVDRWDGGKGREGNKRTAALALNYISFCNLICMLINFPYFGVLSRRRDFEFLMSYPRLLTQITRLWTQNQAWNRFIMSYFRFWFKIDFIVCQENSYSDKNYVP